LIAGIPVVSFDIDGAREVVRDGETGFLLAPRDIQGLAGALIRLAEDASLRKKLGKTGQNRCAEQFRHQKMTADLRAIYQEVLAKKGS